jgi:chitin disaccharide deacetylase
MYAVQIKGGTRMKLITRASDYGLTEAVSCGILRGIREGVITSASMMTVLPGSELSVKWIRDADISLGLEINIVSGRPNAPITLVPNLVEPNGEFIRSGKHRELDKLATNGDHLLYDEALIEVEAQILKSIDWLGRKPDYLCGHSYDTPVFNRALETMAKKYGIPLLSDIVKEYEMYEAPMLWIQRPYSLENQVKSDPLGFILRDEAGMLNHEISVLTMHCGYVDAELFYWSTMNFQRQKDLGALLSPEFKLWIKDNNVELVSLIDLNKH